MRKGAPVFAALGDETRLRILAKLSAGGPLSIAQITEEVLANMANPEGNA